MRRTSIIKDIRGAVVEWRCDGLRVGFVPTMGALHAGHRSLIDAARRECDRVVVSIFVNPTQFAPGEDYERYPRPIEADLQMCHDVRVNTVFTPTAADMYPQGAVTSVHVAGLTERLCGAHRPGHFDGVTTVVAKLFNIVPADRAYFGEKDFQQLKVIERMVRDLDIAIEIVGCPTVREDDGLAVSSRNAYLSERQRRQATSLSRAMRNACDAAAGGITDAAGLIDAVIKEILAAGPVEIDYVSIVDEDSLEPMTSLDGAGRICLAVRIGKCRLIDNMSIGPAGLRG